MSINQILKVFFFLIVVSSCSSNEDEPDDSIIGRWDLSSATLLGANCVSPLGITTFTKGETRCLDTGPELLCPGTYWTFGEDGIVTIEFYLFAPSGVQMNQGSDHASYSIMGSDMLTVCDTDNGICDPVIFDVSDDQLTLTFTEDCAAEAVFIRL